VILKDNFLINQQGVVRGIYSRDMQEISSFPALPDLSPEAAAPDIYPVGGDWFRVRNFKMD